MSALPSGLSLSFSSLFPLPSFPTSFSFSLFRLYPPICFLFSSPLTFFISRSLSTFPPWCFSPSLSVSLYLSRALSLCVSICLSLSLFVSVSPSLPLPHPHTLSLSPCIDYLPTLCLASCTPLGRADQLDTVSDFQEPTLR